MKIKAKQEIQVEISDDEARRIAVQFFLEMFSWKTSYGIVRQSDGRDWVCRIHTAHSSHVFDYHEKIRAASDDDYLAAKVVKKMFNK